MWGQLTRKFWKVTGAIDEHPVDSDTAEFHLDRALYMDTRFTWACTNLLCGHQFVEQRSLDPREALCDAMSCPKCASPMQPSSLPERLTLLDTVLGQMLEPIRHAWICHVCTAETSTRLPWCTVCFHFRPLRPRHTVKPENGDQNGDDEINDDGDDDGDDEGGSDGGGDGGANGGGAGGEMKAGDGDGVGSNEAEARGGAERSEGNGNGDGNGDAETKAAAKRPLPGPPLLPNDPPNDDRPARDTRGAATSTIEQRQLGDFAGGVLGEGKPDSAEGDGAPAKRHKIAAGTNDMAGPTTAASATSAVATAVNQRTWIVVAATTSKPSTFFYHNLATGESTWDAPRGVSMKDAHKSVVAPPLVPATTTTTTTSSAAAASSSASSASDKKSGARLVDGVGGAEGAGAGETKTSDTGGGGKRSKRWDTRGGDGGDDGDGDGGGDGNGGGGAQSESAPAQLRRGGSAAAVRPFSVGGNPPGKAARAISAPSASCIGRGGAIWIPRELRHVNWSLVSAAVRVMAESGLSQLRAPSAVRRLRSLSRPLGAGSEEEGPAPALSPLSLASILEE